MSMFMKQDFTPPILSRRWIALKFRPNYQMHSHKHIVSILESGLLFREDSLEVEHRAPPPGDAGGWGTRGERVAGAVAVAAYVGVLRPKSIKMDRSILIHAAILLSIPISVRLCHTYLASGAGLSELLSAMRDYVSLARRVAACLKEYSFVLKDLDSLNSMLESTHSLLCRQQHDLCMLLSRCSSAILGNVPWVRDDIAWTAFKNCEENDLTKIHHAYLVVQSALLKHIAMAHFEQPKHAERIYKNHNERIYWIHNVIIDYLNEVFKENHETLDRMYRLLKNFGAKEHSDVRKPGVAIKNSWLYSDVHGGVARASMELKMAVSKCTSLDVFLDTCAMNNHEIDVNLLNKDIDDVIEVLTKSLSSMQSSQMRLKKLNSKFGVKTTKEAVENDSDSSEVESNFVTIEDKIPEVKDEVFFCIKTEDDDIQDLAKDTTTGPGQKEKMNTKVVLNELKRKLIKREDLMRERERQALVKTMPDLKEIPEFPRQISVNEYTDKVGYIKKISSKNRIHRRLFLNYKIKPIKSKLFKGKFKLNKRYSDNIAQNNTFELLVSLKSKRHILISVDVEKETIILTKFHKIEYKTNIPESLTEDLSLSKSNSTFETTNGSESRDDFENIKYSKKDLELSSTDSDSEFDIDREELLKDIRRHRVTRKKSYPSKLTDSSDESLKPVSYSFGTGMAIASVLKVNAGIPKLVQEDVFIGDGEVSCDSGNEDDE